MNRRRDDNAMTIIVLGYFIRGPIGGLTWHHLQYVTGLAKLGHRVYFVEDSDDYPCCYDPSRGTVNEDPTYGLTYARESFDRAGLAECWAYHDAHAGEWKGPRAADIIALCAEADLVVDVSGVNPIRDWIAQIPRRALIDTDPAFLQVRHLANPQAHARASAHNVFFTFGENFGREDCGIPDDGFDWIPTRQPIDLDAWPALSPPAGQMRLTTVMQWDSYPAVEHRGLRFGMKSASFPPFEHLPRERSAKFEIALGGDTAPRAHLEALGWKLRNPLDVSRDPWTHQSYVQASSAEFAIAKHGYVVSNSGWFSERSACYLASGRPVIAQETGFSSWLVRDAGVVSFVTAEDALLAIDEVTANYAKHSRSARDIAQQYFGARGVLMRLVERAMSDAPAVTVRNAQIATEVPPQNVGQA